MNKGCVHRPTFAWPVSQPPGSSPFHVPESAPSMYATAHAVLVGVELAAELGVISQ